MSPNPQLPPTVSDPNETARTRARLIQKFSSDGDLLSLGVAIARVVELTSSDGDATQDLAYYVLADAALTQKILRLANTVFYRSAAPNPITTVSRAIFMLGFDTVKTAALALLLVESLTNTKHADAIRGELVESLCASLLGRELARQSNLHGAEEASTAALFHNLGRMLMASHEHALYQHIGEMTATGISQVQASVRVMGCSYEFITETVMREWNFPDFLVAAQEKPPAGALKPSRNKHEWMRQVVAFSAEAARLVLQAREGGVGKHIAPLLARFGSALNLDGERLGQLLALVRRDIEQVVTSLNLTRQDVDLDQAAAPANTLPGVLKLAALDTHAVLTDERWDSGKPINARELLLDGIMGATQMMGAGSYKPSALVLLVVEALYSSLGFRFATVCLRDARKNCYRAIVSIGEQHAERQRAFSFSDAGEPDLFTLAMENNAALMIDEAHSAKIRELLPAWHKQLLPDARSMMVLPLAHGKDVVGLFYADRAKPAPEGITSDEAALIKTLTGQMLTAIPQR